MPYDLAAIRKLILAAFWDEEFLIFCADHFPAVRQQFTTGQTQGQRVQFLLEYAERYGQTPSLLARIKDANPHQYARFEPLLGSPSSPTVPAVPQRISLAKLPSTHPDLFGRERELALLDDAWADPQTHVIEFVAWGGVGKTALVNKWLAGLAAEGFRGAARVFGWSFYSQGAAEGRQASADPFIAAALRWFGDPQPDAGSPWDKGERLAELVQASRTLLVLDGLEPLQYPPGEMAGRLRDPGMASLLRELARHNPGLCIVTTRLAADELRDCEGVTVRRHDLEALSPAAGEALLRRAGVKGTPAELQAASTDYSGHALTLTLLGSYLATVHRGEIRQRDKIGRLTDERRQGGHARRVMASYERWFAGKPEAAILRLMGLFDRPAEGGAIKALLAAPAIAGLTEPLTGLSPADWAYAVAALREARLLDAADDADPDVLDAHPLVREHFGEQLRGAHAAAWAAAHGRLYEHYRQAAAERPDTLEAMAPLYAAVAHGCAAGRHQDALDDVYWLRISRRSEHFSWSKLGAFGADLAALAGFFDADPPWRRPVAGLREAAKAFILNEAGFDLRALGRLAEALAPMAAGLEAYVAQEQWEFAARLAGNLSELALTAGDLPAALRYAAQSVELADRSGDAFMRMYDRTTLADALHQAGRLDAAAARFREAEEMQRARQPEYPLLYSLQGYRYCDLLLAQGQAEEVLRRAEKFFEWRVPEDSLLDIALDHLTLGRAHLMLHLTPRPPSLAGKGEQRGLGGSGRAAAELDQAVTGLRQAGAQEFIVRGLLARAGLRRVTADFERARCDLDEALLIATRGGMRLHQADCRLEYGRLSLATGDSAGAREHCAVARRLVAELGYGRRDREVRELERELGSGG